MLDFMQDDADEIVIDTTALHKGTSVSEYINVYVWAAFASNNWQLYFWEHEDCA